MCFGIALALLAGEVTTRGLVSFRYAYDPDLGQIAAPGSRFRKWGEGNGSGLISKHGARVYPSDGPSIGRVPILVLGDSFSEAFQVGDGELFSNQLGALLDADGIPVTIANLGRSGYSMADYVCRSTVFERLFAPEWVVVQLNDWDFDGDAFASQWRHARFRRTTAGLECVPPFPVPPPPERGRLRALLHEARNAFGLPDALVARLKARVAADDSHLPLFRAGQANAAEARSEMTSPPPVDEEMRLLRSAWGDRLIVLYLPPFTPGDLRTPGQTEMQAEAAARRAGIRFRSLREEFPELEKRRAAPYGFSNSALNTGHWNADGHAAGARVLRSEFLDLRSHGLL